jgi:hypothetical protein
LCLAQTSHARVSNGSLRNVPAQTEEFNQSSKIRMYRRPEYPGLKNVVFLDLIAETLRQATSDIAHEEPPEGIRLLLRRLERLQTEQCLRIPDDPSAA